MPVSCGVNCAGVCCGVWVCTDVAVSGSRQPWGRRGSTGKGFGQVAHGLVVWSAPTEHRGCGGEVVGGVGVGGAGVGENGEGCGGGLVDVGGGQVGAGEDCAVPGGVTDVGGVELGDGAAE